MKKVLEIISCLALITIVLAPALFYMDRWTLEQNKLSMLIATMVWFATAPFWVGSKKKGESA